MRAERLQAASRRTWLRLEREAAERLRRLVAARAALATLRATSAVRRHALAGPISDTDQAGRWRGSRLP